MKAFRSVGIKLIFVPHTSSIFDVWSRTARAIFYSLEQKVFLSVAGGVRDSRECAVALDYSI